MFKKTCKRKKLFLSLFLATVIIAIASFIAIGILGKDHILTTLFVITFLSLTFVIAPVFLILTVIYSVKKNKLINKAPELLVNSNKESNNTTSNNTNNQRLSTINRIIPPLIIISSLPMILIDLYACFVWISSTFITEVNSYEDKVTSIALIFTISWSLLSTILTILLAVTQKRIRESKRRHPKQKIK